MPRWLKPTTARQMSLTEAAWIAGFFDGEGSIGQYLAGRGKKHPTWFLSIPNTHFGSLDYCQRITGVGRINDKNSKSRPVHHQPQRMWRVDRQRDIAQICRQMLPYLVIKRDRVEAFLMMWVDIEE
jgi:hypothetical protein